MDLISLIKDDHEIIHKFILEIQEANNGLIKKKIFTEMLTFLQAYFRSIEIALYSFSLNKANYELKDLALDGYEEHYILENLIYRLGITSNIDDFWLKNLSDFCQVLELHLTAENTDFYCNLNQYLTTSEINQISDIYLKVKKIELIYAAETGYQKTVKNQLVVDVQVLN